MNAEELRQSVRNVEKDFDTIYEILHRYNVIFEKDFRDTLEATRTEALARLLKKHMETQA